MRVVLVPSLDVESEQSSELDENDRPALSVVHSRTEDDGFERGVKRIDAMIEEFSQGT